MKPFFLITLLGLASLSASAAPEFSNPITTDFFTADPAPFIGGDGKLWLYTSHDQPDADIFNMVDYCAFSTENMHDWEFHGYVLHTNDVPWVDGYFWAPAGLYRDGTYYLYFPIGGLGKTGVVTSKSPTGPWTDPIGGPMDTATMDPYVFTDDDGQAYMVGSIPKQQLEPQPGCLRTPFVVKMRDDLLGYEGEKRLLEPHEYEKHVEAAWLHKHNGKYYYTHKGKGGLLYSMSDSPMGPYKNMGYFMPGKYLNHQGIIKYKNEWYIFFQTYPVSNYLKRRNVSLTRLEYNSDGSIKTVEEPVYDPVKVQNGKDKYGHIPQNKKKRWKNKKQEPKK
ncbi:family 43 glycosylhydrolase [Pontiella agarivorans]|uniref:Family 43 glycosylhydrolase n=1 Tax=Pontiella agarivorans TaxID=3038953 RepID=A0ABU5MY00_9BACT|nr:family 43 glycosylhydrolase [Pontiella agarivorans]MDZ8119093.1 family 43 glycosylhydrolase [Pontiella agarivorans]